MGTIQTNLKCEHVDDPHTMFKLIKSGKMTYEDFTASQIYDLKKKYGFLFDEEYNSLPKAYPEDTDVLSQSQIQSYMKCPRYWYFKSKLKLKGEKKDDTWLKFGSVIHLILSEFYINIDEEMATQDPQTHFNYVLKLLSTRHWDYSLDKKLLEVDANDIFGGFSRLFGQRFLELKSADMLDSFYPVSVEENIRATSQPLMSIVDRINKDFITFADYKTNKVFPEILLRKPETLSPEELNFYNYSIQNYVIQAVVNAICIHDKYKVMPKACIFIFVRHLDTPHQGMLPIYITQDFIKQVIAIIDRMYAAMAGDVYEKTKDPDSCIEYGGCEYSMACDAYDLCIADEV